MSFSEFILYKGGDVYSINSCDTIETFYNLRFDLDKLKYASYITKIISDVTTENQNNYRALQLFLNTLYTMAETEKELDFIISIFRIRILSIIGYRPQIDSCGTCKQKEKLEYFSFRDSSLKCKACVNQDKGALQISETTADAIRYIILSDPKKIFSFNISEDSLKELIILSQIYINEKLEKEYKM